MFKIGICEDNKIFSLELKSIIERKFTQYNLESKINCFYSGEDTLEGILNAKERYDIIFFDIELPKLNGIEVARKIRELYDDTIFIFITYLDEKVYEALDLTIFHFIRKSHFQKEINLILDSLIKKLDYLTEKYAFPIGEDNVYFRLYDILYLEILNRQLIIHTKENVYTSTYRSLKDISFDLTKKHFYEVYRGIMVNLNHVKDFIDNKIILSNGDIVYIARRRLNGFKEEFYKYISSKREG
ncbi:two component transcriptional regulator, LytTR family [Tissierella praeacuta DSM 18095]|uniref:Two component transcriptional regulator, LytTR family n=1 Tax=Tissierella praeacuta DSM 18095 TaxID=1123404 RepID=A0A1M4VR59_9FIRM|nr:LytTR family DNA-binding domain-containing protein [Tissierella praeacuta]SHE71337.1 two component transcriptional regulator, LytTR family [Tissierella praeacuta DSM 18095]SUO98959.1 Sensory transduction protein lytR [Tissierella praeacuta]